MSRVRIATALLEMGRFEEGLEAARRAIHSGRLSDPIDWVMALRAAARCFAGLGRMNAARTTLAEALAVLRGSDCENERANLRQTSEELGIDLREIGVSEAAPTANGISGNSARWIPLRDGRVFLADEEAFVDRVRQIAQTPLPVLIEGESGTGKELVAHLIHEFGPRSHRPFIIVDRTTLTESLAEAELFGVARGAFTGADSTRDGLVGAADGGTLFLDELAELSARLARRSCSGSSRRGRIVGSATPRSAVWTREWWPQPTRTSIDWSAAVVCGQISTSG